MIGKETWKDYKKDFGVKSTLTAMYIFVLACTLLINILLPFSIVLTIPFFVLPFTFSYFAVLCGFPLSKQAPIKSFFLFYPVYYSKLFYGGFRALLGFIKGILISIVFSMVLTIILYYSYLRIQPGFAEILKEFEAANGASEIQTALEHFMAFEPAKMTTSISSLVGSIIGSWVFIRHCLLNSEKFCLNLLNTKPIPMKAVNRLYIVASNNRRKQFLKEYYGAVWYVVLSFVLLFAGASTVATFVFKISAEQSVFIGLFVALVLLFPFIPYYFSVIKNIFLASGDDYSKASIHLSEKAIEELKNNMQISEEDKKKLEEELQKSREEYERMIKEAEEAEKQIEQKEDEKK